MSLEHAHAILSLSNIVVSLKKEVVFNTTYHMLRKTLGGVVTDVPKKVFRRDIISTK